MSMTYKAWRCTCGLSCGCYVPDTVKAERLGVKGEAYRLAIALDLRAMKRLGPDDRLCDTKGYFTCKCGRRYDAARL